MTTDQVASATIDALFRESGLPKAEQANIRRSLFDGDAPQRWDFASLLALSVYLGARCLGLMPQTAAKLFAALAPLAAALNDPHRRHAIPSTWQFVPATGELHPASTDIGTAARFGVVVLPLGLYIQRLERQVIRLQTGADKAMEN
jgi:hypothetical protein